MAASTKSSELKIDPYSAFPSIKGQRVKFTSSTPFTPTFIQEHTQSKSQSYTSRIQGRNITLENPAKESRAKKERQAKHARQKQDSQRRKAGIISRGEAKKKGVWVLEKNIARYDTFLPIHHMWCSYMTELMNFSPAPPDSVDAKPPRLPNAAVMHAKLVKADFHGCIIRVKESKNPSLVGCAGIIIHETENTFKIVTSKNSLKVIPKENSIFTFSIPLYQPAPFDLSTLNPSAPLPVSPPSAASDVDIPTPPAALPPSYLKEPSIQFELYGNQFRFRSADRATRKFKAKETIEL